MPNRSGKHKILFFILAAALFTFAFLDLMLGSVHIPLKDVLETLFGQNQSEHRLIIFSFRFPKMLTAITAGSALSVAGLQMQSMFRNPLAGPYVLGISSGASLGVALLTLSGAAVLSRYTIAGAAWTGAALVLAFVFAASLRIRQSMSLLILGVLLGAAVSALITVLQYFSPADDLQKFIVWTMGNLSATSAEELRLMIPAIIIGLAAAMAIARSMDVLSLGESFAHSAGLNLYFIRAVILFSSALLAGTATAFVGPVGFIGVIVPHIARSIFRTEKHSILIPASALTGAVFLLIADIISQVPGKDFVLPINAIAALAGIPVLIRIVLKSRL